MSLSAAALGFLFKIVANNPRVKAKVDEAVNTFLDGFAGKQLTPKDEIDLLKKLVQNLNDDEFPSCFEDQSGYFGFLLGIILPACFLRGRPMVIRDLYVPNRCFYFPVPAKRPEVFPGKHLRADPAFGMRTLPEDGGDEPDEYRFYAIQTNGLDLTHALNVLRDLGPDQISQNGANGDYEGLASALSISTTSIKSIRAVGRSKVKNAIVLLGVDLGGDDDIQISPKDPKATRSRIIEDLEGFLDKPTF